MKKVIITGAVTVNFKQVLMVPDDEVSDLLASEADICANIDLDDATIQDVEDYRNIKTEVFGRGK